MARTRKTSKEALEEKIEKAEADVIAAKKKYDQATANLKELLDKRDAIRKEEILSAVVKSGRSYEERFFFLPHTIAKRNGKIRYFIPIPDRYAEHDTHKAVSIQIVGTVVCGMVKQF